VTLISADFVDDMRIKCKVKLSYDTIILIVFVLAFPKADLGVPVYMELPLRFDASDNKSQKF
jgi:hypothetical protein